MVNLKRKANGKERKISLRAEHQWMSVQKNPASPGDPRTKTRFLAVTMLWLLSRHPPLLEISQTHGQGQLKPVTPVTKHDLTAADSLFFSKVLSLKRLQII